jgi:hypothetical protein
MMRRFCSSLTGVTTGHSVTSIGAGRRPAPGGRRDDAQEFFRAAEEMQAKLQHEYPLLYSLRGFQYCDLLLAAPERAAWQTVLGRAELPLGPNIGAAQQHSPTMELMESCRHGRHREKLADAEKFILSSRPKSASI